MLTKSLLPDYINIPLMPEEMVRSKFMHHQNIGEAVLSSITKKIMEVMGYSKVAYQYINFVLWHKEFVMEVMSWQQAKNTYPTIIHLNSVAAYHHQQRRLIFILSDVSSQALLHEFWHAYLHLVRIKNNQDLANCGLAVLDQALSYPFTPSTFTTMAQHYNQVFSLYAELNMIKNAVVNADPPLTSMDSKRLVGQPLFGVLRQLLAPEISHCTQIGVPQSLIDICAITQSIKNLLITCQGYAQTCHIPGIGGGQQILNITNPSLWKQLPTVSAQALQVLETVMGDHKVPLKEAFIMNQMFIQRNIPEVDQVAANIKGFYDCTRLVVTECDALVMQLSPILAPLRQSQKWLDFHIAEAQKTFEHCNPKLQSVWKGLQATVPESQSIELGARSTWWGHLGTGIGSTFLGMAVSWGTHTMKKSVKPATAEMLENSVGKVIKLGSHCMVANKLWGTPYIGVATFVADEVVLKISERCGKIIHGVTASLSTSYSVAGLVYSSEDPQIFVTSVAGGMIGQGIMNGWIGEPTPSAPSGRPRHK